MAIEYTAAPMSRRAIVYHTDGAEIFCGYGKNIPCPDVDIISAVAGQLENFGYFRRHAEFLKQGSMAWPLNSAPAMR